MRVKVSFKCCAVYIRSVVYANTWILFFFTDEMKIPIVYAITEMNSANEVQLSIPECGFNIDDYFSCFQQST